MTMLATKFSFKICPCPPPLCLHIAVSSYPLPSLLPPKAPSSLFILPCAETEDCHRVVDHAYLTGGFCNSDSGATDFLQLHFNQEAGNWHLSEWLNWKRNFLSHKSANLILYLTVFYFVIYVICSSFLAVFKKQAKQTNEGGKSKEEI